MTDALDQALDRLRTLKRDLGEHATASGHVQLHMDGSVAQLVLDHEARRNALTVGMMIDLAEALQTLSSWPCSVVLLRAKEPRVFCAGGDLSELPHAPPEAAEAMCVAMSAVLDGLLDLPAVSVCLLDGLAVGGGAELTTACDVRLGTPNARVHFVQASLGIAPGWGGTGRLVGHIGRRAALRVLTRGQAVGLDEGLALGLFDDALPGEDPMAEALAWAMPILDLAPAAVQAVKRQVVAAAPARAGSAEDEARAFGTVWGGPAHRSALAGLARHRS